MTNRLTPKDFETWRRQLRENSDGEFDTTLAHQLVAKLMVEVETLWGERARTTAEALDQAATALEKRLRDLGRRGPPSAPGYGCAMCRDAEARSFITYLRGMANPRVHHKLPARQDDTTSSWAGCARSRAAGR